MYGHGTEAEVEAFYRALLDRDPTIGSITAISKGMDRFGRSFGSPSIADHRSALKATRDARVGYCPGCAKEG